VPDIYLDNHQTAQDVQALAECQQNMTRSLQETRDWLDMHQREFQGQSSAAWQTARSAVEKALVQLGAKYQAGQVAFQEMVNIQNQADGRGALHLG
jgi:hypothetical protein